jgi:ubiquitin C-terminal hydrolase
VQCLQNCIVFRKLITNEKNISRSKLIESFGNLVLAMNDEERRRIPMDNFIRCLRERKANIHQQGDVQEFVLWLIDEIHKDIKVPRKNNILLNEPRALSEIEKLSLQLKKHWKESTKDGLSDIARSFYGQYITQIKCGNCDALNHAFEIFTVLTLAPSCIVNGKMTITDCLDQYFCNESMNTWKCDKCKQKVSSMKTTRLWKLPSVLLIGTPAYLFENINFKSEDIVDIGKYTLAYANKTLNTKYMLKGIAYHTGRNRDSGHYFALCKTKTNGWKLIDDDIVVSTDKNMCHGKPYMLFYEQV